MILVKNKIFLAKFAMKAKDLIDKPLRIFAFFARHKNKQNISRKAR
jgi:hypothetical protein